MDHLNFCRQFLHEFDGRFDAMPDGPQRVAVTKAIELAKASVKFILPVGGRLYDDPQYKELDESEPLHLPYKRIALEYRTDEPPRPGLLRCNKHIVLAEEMDQFVGMLMVPWSENNRSWMVYPPIMIPKTGYLARDLPAVQGYCRLNIRRVDESIPADDYSDELGALLCFLNVLRCSNITTEKSEPKRNGKAKKGALPFDTYRILTIEAPRESRMAGAMTGGTHRSPREHLRRGHIRRYETGKRIWVNGSIVNAGKTEGRVFKDYALKPQGSGDQ